MIFFEYVAEALFYAFVFVTFLGGILAVRSKLLMHAVLGLALSLFGVAGLYFHLGSPFMAMMQILIYVGAVCVVIVLGAMVGNTPDQLATKKLTGRHLPLSLLACAGCFATLFIAMIVRTNFVPATERLTDLSIRAVGDSLLHQYCLAFELISLVLLTAIIGAIILARGGREERDEETS